MIHSNLQGALELSDGLLKECMHSFGPIVVTYFQVRYHADAPIDGSMKHKLPFNEFMIAICMPDEMWAWQL